MFLKVGDVLPSYVEADAGNPLLYEYISLVDLWTSPSASGLKYPQQDQEIPLPRSKPAELGQTPKPAPRDGWLPPRLHQCTSNHDGLSVLQEFGGGG